MFLLHTSFVHIKDIHIILLFKLNKKSLPQDYTELWKPLESQHVLNALENRMDNIQFGCD